MLESLKTLLAKKQAVPFVEYMQHVLYAPGDGYYSSAKAKFGADGDFVTAPELTPLFGRTVARQCRAVLAAIAPADMLEFGAGSGRLCIDVLRELDHCGQIYGGLHEEDLLFLDHMMKRDRLVITEFSFMGPPTHKDLQKKAEQLMGLEWQGWTGKFFHTFDPAQERSVPPWVPILYKNQNGNPWPRQHQGIIFVHEDETLVVLEYPTHINTPYPLVMTDRQQRRKFGVSNRIPYPGWFDVTLANCDDKTVLSWFELNLTPEGRVLMQSHGIPTRFPAVIKQKHTNRMYYFAGDFGYSPLKHRFVKFKGSRFAELFFSDLTDPTDKNGFFYTYYLPLMNNIIRDYHEEILTR